MADKKLFTPLSGTQRIFEAVLIAITLMAAYLLLALLTYHPADPGWSQTSWQGEVKNLAGSAGAWLADITMFTFGAFSYLVPPLTVLLGWSLFWRPSKLLEVDYLTLSVRIIGFILTVLGMSAIASMNFNDLQNFSAGGLVGDVIASAVVPLFGGVGANLMLLCFVATGITLFTGWSWLTIVERIGAACTGSVSAIYHFPTTLGRWLTGGWRQPRYEGPDPLLEGGVGAFDQDDEDEPHGSWTRNPKAKNRAQKTKSDEWLPELDEDTFQFEPQFDDEDEDETPAPKGKRVASGRQRPVVSQEDEDDLDLPWAEGDDEPEAPVAPAPVKAKRRPQPGLAPLPSIELLDRPPAKTQMMSKDELERMGRLVEAKLADYNVQAKVVGVYPGPVITRFELDLAPGMKASKITNLSRDLARSLSASSVRVVEVIPGKTYVGIELPNRVRQTVYLRETLDCEAFRDSRNPLTMGLGQDIAGEPVVVNLAKMPHLLVAGTTGSGKSVGVNTMIISMLYKSSPEDLRFIMIDPKMLELSVYEGIPHLLTEVVTDMKDAANALRWCVGEMERRYKLMSAVGVRNLKGYNDKVLAAIEAGDPLLDPLWRPGDSMDQMPPELEKLPHIVVVVDEFADMMMIVGKKVEELIARIAQKARAAGIHLILATQRPSVDVITGLIKANIPTRISFQVSSKIDSRTILDQGGAESLLGMGDMLYMPAGTSNPTRVHGAFVDDHEVHKVVADWKLRGEPDYIDEILSGESDGEGGGGDYGGGGDEELDPLFDEAVAFVVESRRGSTSSVQRKFKIGYNRAARLIEQMENQGIVSAPGGNGQRDVLAPPPVRD
ncbi:MULTISPECIES: DNA translocase FtsK [Aeromonas]|uniref:DNA translocase FtsK n=1 Tax=Aeromonas sanarellii TaxID=633415 RepID=A0ABS4B1C0_9GAMM|nr:MULTISPECIES: DNA translocase FtsK 4TM domain-containing protein [Aeromonas]MBP0601279.1 DNA translocase FtsK 4TM domain-containing protein [Aeromonas sanarellii]QXW31338.1 DNA translocase FtsK 4TM domain-containing protein [Aeromonas sanarellii]WOX50014.1 DNA translocase FtsK 4TM domain-containing protein [Aeromonas sp. XH]